MAPEANDPGPDREEDRRDDSGAGQEPAEDRPADQSGDKASGNARAPNDFPVIGIGASAGGLDALTRFLKALPDKMGAAFVFIQHLDPEHESSLVEILPRWTKMKVVQAGDGMRLQRNHLYIIPPGRDLAVLHGELQVMQRPERPARHMPVDYFFRSLAEDRGHRAIAVVLSGTGTDGAAGIKAVKAEGGVTLAQEEESAQYTGMPQAAISTGQVDLVLSPEDIARELVRIVDHPHLASETKTEEPPAMPSRDALQKIFIILRRSSGVDFSQYKRSTVERRIARRMILHRIDSADQYLRYLEQTPREVEGLFEDMLISVTSFFREPEVFSALKQTVFSRIAEDKDPAMPIRIWVPACSTGEEVYSIAIALQEHLASQKLQPAVQIFGTDISQGSIDKARTGVYPENIAGDVSQERLRRFFSRTDGGYRINKSVRDVCIFAQQNAVRDPPFSNLDLLSCRNFLIYLGPELQKRVMPVFHYALKDGGYLLLGSSETTGGFSDLFMSVDRERRIYARKSVATRLPRETGRYRPLKAIEPSPTRSTPEKRGAGDLEREADRLIVSRYAPSGVIVNQEMEILNFRGSTSRFLEPAPGHASLDLMRMARPGLAVGLRAALHECRKQHEPILKEGIKIVVNGDTVAVDVEVHPLGRSGSEDLHFLVLFKESPRRDREATSKQGDAGTEKGPHGPEYDNLLQELNQTKGTMQSIIEEQEATNEELRAANEEIQSANEELQSTNEELETAK
ncbi:MAG: hypothetical protein GF355_03570, partial [Candidatus Eisenbacteria bacterium]|nr:hypothetical protein [Candidatus Eisenbacteria bacterium]